jgi:hypothetical protein
MFTKSKLLPVLGLIGLAAGGGAQAAGLVAAGNAFHISGSTALDNQIKDALLLPSSVGGPCTAGTISIYTDAPPLAGGNITKAHQTTIVCALANAIGSIPASTVVAFTKESNGGSNEGTFYPAAQQTLAFFDATQAPAGCTSEGAIAAGHYFTHQQAITAEFDGCTGVIVQAIPDVGVADEDPALFNIGPQAISSALIAKLNTTPLFQNQFAIAVSLNLYRALQAQQGLTVGDDTLAQMPTLSKQQISGLFGGNITNWNQIVSSSGVGLASSTVYTCRRGDNSGSNVSADVYFLRNRCNYSLVGGALTAVGPSMVQISSGISVANGGNGSPCAGLPASQTPENNGCAWTAGAAPAGNLSDVTFGGTATGDVISCLDAHSRPASNTFAYGMIQPSSKFDDPNGVEATGEAGTAHFRYIAIDGHKPTVEGMANGTYDYAMDNVENLWTGLTGKPLAVGNFLGTLFQSPLALTDILVAQPNAQSLAHAVDANYVTGGLQDGFTATPNAPPVTVAVLDANPVSGFTLAFTGAVNNCQVPIEAGASISKEVF